MASLVFSVGRQTPTATPVFAQAYGLSCSACHTQMPILNAFGRYVQRTGYAALDPQTLKHALPFFVFDIGTAYTVQSGQPQSAYRVNGPGHTTILQANGAFGPDLTYKFEQILVAGGQTGFLYETWLAYNNLLNRRGHLFVGKLPEVSIDEYASGLLPDVNTAGGPALPNFAVGVHDYALDYEGGRWGAKFNYVGGKAFVEAAYLGNATGANSFGDAYDFSKSSDTSFQWRVAYADPAKPWEIGIIGEKGALGFTGIALRPGLKIDEYNVFTPYIMKDPRPGSPGFRVEYSMATDGNPGYVGSGLAGPSELRKAGGIASSWIVGSVYQMALHEKAMINVTYYHTNSALSEIGLTGLVEAMQSQTGVGPGFSYAINPYARIQSAIYLADKQHPAYHLNVWLSPPSSSRLK